MPDDARLRPHPGYNQVSPFVGTRTRLRHAEGIMMRGIASLFTLVLACTGNRPPDVPTPPVGPEYGIVGQEYAYWTIITDPDGDSVRCLTDWGNGDSPEWSDWQVSGDTFHLGHTWIDHGIYDVCVGAEDTTGARSHGAGATTVQIGRPPRQPAMPAGPDMGWLDSTYIYRIWSDNAGTAIRYILNWDDGQSDTTLFGAGSDTWELTHAWSSPDAYLVAAQALDRWGIASVQSEPLAVVIDDPVGEVLWLYDFGDRVRCSPAIGRDGTIYVTAGKQLHAIHPNGTLAWSYGDEVTGSASVSQDGTVHVSTNDSCVVAFHPDGTVKWRCKIEARPTSCPPIAADRTVYTCTYSGFLYAIDANGEVKWRFDTGGYMSLTAAVAGDGTVYFGTETGTLYALNPDGSLKWRFETEGPVDSPVAIAGDGGICLASEDGYLYMLKANGEVKWQYRVYWSSQMSAVIAEDGTVYYWADNRVFYAFDSTGRMLWSFEHLKPPRRGSPALCADGSIYAITNAMVPRMTLWTITGNGQAKMLCELQGTADYGPTVAPNGTVYTCSGSWLSAYGGAVPPAKAPWPMWQRNAQHTGRADGP